MQSYAPPDPEKTWQRSRAQSIRLKGYKYTERKNVNQRPGLKLRRLSNVDTNSRNYWIYADRGSVLSAGSFQGLKNRGR